MRISAQVSNGYFINQTDSKNSRRLYLNKSKKNDPKKDRVLSAYEQKMQLKKQIADIKERSKQSDREIRTNLTEILDDAQKVVDDVKENDKNCAKHIDDVINKKADDNTEIAEQSEKAEKSEEDEKRKCKSLDELKSMMKNLSDIEDPQIAKNPTFVKLLKAAGELFGQLEQNVSDTDEMVKSLEEQIKDISKNTKNQNKEKGNIISRLA